LNDETKKIQIELAKIERDAKAYLILSAGAAAFFGLLVINFLLMSINTTTPFQKNSILIGSSLSAIFGLGFVAFFVIKMRRKQEEIKGLKKRLMQVNP
jgi:cytochrome c biogenesis protein CcdA